MATNPSFADWYQSAAVTPPEGLLDKRWVAVEKIAKDATTSSVVQLCKLFALPESETLVPAGFREAFKAQDDNFLLKGGLQELRVLAGAVLRVLIEKDEPLATTAALSICCGAFGPRESLLPERDHLLAAERFIVKTAATLRQTDAPTALKVSSFSKKRLGELLPQNVFAANQTPQMHEPVSSLFAEAGANFMAIQRSLEEMHHAISVQAEELNALWWLQTGFNKTLNKPFAEIGHPAAPILLASELADLTTFSPGPVSSAALLAHALKLAGAESSDTSIKDAVNATPKSWREATKATRDLSDVGALCPISLAVDRSLDTDGEMEWLPVYRKACDIPVDRPFQSLQVALQLYRELLLLRDASRTAS